MRYIYLLFLLLTLGIHSQATECVDKLFEEENVNLYLCQNYSNYHETRTLLFKARTKALNDYIKTKIKSGQLQNQKFEIEIYDQVLTYHHLELTQKNNHYLIHVSGFPTLEQLIAFVNHFTTTDWKPFSTSHHQDVGPEIISKEINTFFQNAPVFNATEVIQHKFTVWAKGNWHLDYYHDSLHYFVGVFPLAIRPTSALPVAIQDRILLFQTDTIFVMKGKSVIQKMPVNQPISEDYDVYAFDQWVNICHGGHNNWVYSYSYTKNKFYKRSDKLRAK